MCSSVIAYANDAHCNEREYESAVAEIMKTYYDDKDSALAALEELDTVLLEEPTIVEHASSNGILNTYATKPTDYTLKVYSFRRAGSLYYHLQWLLTANKKEYAPGPLDYVSLEWDSNRASYYLSNGDSKVSTVQAKKSGIVLFNVQDSDLKKGESAYGTVQVKPTKKNTSIEYGSKFVHTYTKLLVSGSASYSFASSISLNAKGDASLGISNNYGFTVNVGSKTNKWQIWADNAVKV